MAEKLDMKSMNITEDNVRKIQALFPNVVTEVMGEDGTFKLAIDFDALKQELSNDLINEKQERYQMTWPDKSKAKVIANSRITATLRPDKEKSVNFDNTENLYIEGDNLDVLKLLQETYLHKIDVIYIDPPYNTGNNLIYKNDFSQDAHSFLEDNNSYDTYGNRLVKNLDSDGRFHTNWLNMLYPRLVLAKNLLKENGVLICTIDQSEVNTLGIILKEIFSSKTVTQVAIVHNPSGTQGNNFAFNNEFAFFVYNDNIRNIALEKRSEENADIRPFMNGAKGDTTNYLRASGAKTFYPIVVQNGSIVGFGEVCDDNYHPKSPNVIQPDGSIYIYPIDNDGVERKWLFERGTVDEIRDELHLKYIKDKKLYEVIRVKNEINYKTVWNDSKYNAKTHGTILLKSLMGATVFSNPKSLYAVEECLKAVIHDKNDAIILDFFSGSSTTAHAVMDINHQDGGKRKFIMVQLPENLDENLKTAIPKEKETLKNAIKLCDKLGAPHTIAEVAKERIRRAGRKIKDENDLNAQNLDVGFRVLKLDSSNMNDVYYNPNAFSQSMLDMTVDNVKADRTPLDLLFQVMLELGVELSADIVEKTVNGKKIYAVNGNDLIACFDNDIDNDVITAIATEKPLYAVFKDKSFATDSVGINNEQLFKTYSPATVVKVL